MPRLVWWGTFAIGAYGALAALGNGDWDAMLLWLTWIGFFASLEFQAKP